jgi:hypothetical protein
MSEVSLTLGRCHVVYDYDYIVCYCNRGPALLFRRGLVIHQAKSPRESIYGWKRMFTKFKHASRMQRVARKILSALAPYRPFVVAPLDEWSALSIMLVLKNGAYADRILKAWRSLLFAGECRDGS